MWQTLSEPVLAIVDSGSSYITVPRVIYKEITRTKFNTQNYC